MTSPKCGMKKTEAKRMGFCGKCAAFTTGKWMCGAGDPSREAKVYCHLTKETADRWCAEHGLCGEIQRHEKPEFGEEKYHITPKRGKRSDIRYVYKKRKD